MDMNRRTFTGAAAASVLGALLPWRSGMELPELPEEVEAAPEPQRAEASEYRLLEGKIEGLEMRQEVMDVSSWHDDFAIHVPHGPKIVEATFADRIDVEPGERVGVRVEFPDANARYEACGIVRFAHTYQGRTIVELAAERLNVEAPA